MKTIGLIYKESTGTISEVIDDPTDGNIIRVHDSLYEDLKKNFKKFKFRDRKLTKDEEFEQIQSDLIEIEELKQALSDTDYTVIKANELTVLNKDIPNDLLNKIHLRESQRERINQIEERLGDYKK